MEGKVTLPERVTAAQVGVVEIVAYGAQEVVAEVAVEERALLVLADMTYPGWQAWVDGVPSPILTVDDVFRGLALQPGSHVVRFAYRPAP